MSKVRKIVTRGLLDVALMVLLLLGAVLLAGVVSVNRPDCFTCGANIASTIWLGSVVALQPLIWISGIAKLRRVGIWVSSVLIGLGCYVVLEHVGARLFAAGNSLGMNIAFYANLAFILVCGIVSVLMSMSEVRKERVETASVADDEASE